MMQWLIMIVMMMMMMVVRMKWLVCYDDSYDGNDHNDHHYDYSNNCYWYNFIIKIYNNIGFDRNNRNVSSQSSYSMEFPIIDYNFSEYCLQ